MLTNVPSRQPDAGNHGTAGVVALALAVALVAAACGASRTTVHTAPVASLSEAVDCSQETGKEMGFDVVAIDRSAHRVVLERPDPSVRRSDPSFQRAVGQLEVLPAEREAGAASPLSVEVRTFHEYRDRRGLTRRQREPSDGILAAADSLLSACASDGRGGP